MDVVSYEEINNFVQIIMLSFFPISTPITLCTRSTEAKICFGIFFTVTNTMVTEMVKNWKMLILDQI